MRRTGLLRVVWQESKDIKVPDTSPELANTRFLRGRMSQMRSSLGMSEQEISSLATTEDNTADVPQQEPKSSRVVAQKTWAEIVEEREKSGHLYSPRTIQEAFPYLNGQARGMPDFKDDFREEQLLAHMQATTNHPMSVMDQFQQERFKFFWKSLASFFVGYIMLSSYLHATEYEDEPGFRQKDFYLAPEELVKRVEQNEEELVPILRAGRDGYTIMWVPSSKAAQMMWTHREGGRKGQQNILLASFTEARMLHPGVSYSFPASLAHLADTPDSQIKWQKDQQEIRDAMLRMKPT
eukprot:TRINITY_DN19880_c0_g1_i1.p1 TRINITY_DN19880_c0_g1~~TRINITY_DN19880_c0_g1_i1.p1  ORF type:complete len:295 (+),score=47.60 TRINITY_DN19880_c0_g1_i1:64-948(+)